MTPLSAKVSSLTTSSHMGRMPQCKPVKLNGREVVLYSIGWLAHMVKKDPHTIRQYERRKVLPEPLLKTKSKRRWYLAEEISGYASIIKSASLRPNVNIESMGLRDTLHAYRNRIKGKLQHNLEAVQSHLKQETEVYDYANGMRNNLAQQKITKVKNATA